MITPRTEPSPMTASMSATTAPVCAASASAAARLGSTTYLSFNSAELAALRACICPIRPAPNMATLYIAATTMIVRFSKYNESPRFSLREILPALDNTIDLIAIGRSSVDLYGEQIGGRLEDMGSFAKYVGGSPANAAIAAARLGLRSGLVTRVGADHMGRYIREELIREGVDVRGVHTDPNRLTALVLLGIRDRETFPLIFYRENCADMALCEQDLDPALLAAARAALITGTHLSTPG